MYKTSKITNFKKIFSILTPIYFVGLNTLLVLGLVYYLSLPNPVATNNRYVEIAIILSLLLVTTILEFTSIKNILKWFKKLKINNLTLSLHSVFYFVINGLFLIGQYNFLITIYYFYFTDIFDDTKSDANSAQFYLWAGVFIFLLSLAVQIFLTIYLFKNFKKKRHNKILA